MLIIQIQHTAQWGLRVNAKYQPRVPIGEVAALATSRWILTQTHVERCSTCEENPTAFQCNRGECRQTSWVGLFQHVCRNFTQVIVLGDSLPLWLSLLLMLLDAMSRALFLTKLQNEINRKFQQHLQKKQQQFLKKTANEQSTDYFETFIKVLPVAVECKRVIRHERERERKHVSLVETKEWSAFKMITLKGLSSKVTYGLLKGSNIRNRGCQEKSDYSVVETVSFRFFIV